MKCLNVRLALGLKNLGSLSKPVLKHRFDLKILKTPTQVRNALIYVLTNASKHFRSRKVFDWFSSIAICNEIGILKCLRPDLIWQRPPIPSRVKKALELIISPPQSWLAIKGWKKGTKNCDLFDPHPTSRTLLQSTPLARSPRTRHGAAVFESP